MWEISFCGVTRRLKWQTPLPAEVTNSDLTDAVPIATHVSWETRKRLSWHLLLFSPTPLRPCRFHSNLSRWFLLTWFHKKKKYYLNKSHKLSVRRYRGEMNHKMLFYILYKSLLLSHIDWIKKEKIIFGMLHNVSHNNSESELDCSLFGNNF